MIETYTDLLIKVVPQYVYEGSLSVLCIVIVLLLALKGRKVWRYIVWLMLLEYSFLLYCSTVIFRKNLPVRSFDLMPFWSYKAYLEGKEFYLAENIMNVVVFVPIGFLFGFALYTENVRKVLMLGLGLSFGIEVLQFVFKKGFTEFDDVMHNTLGCLIGYGIYYLLRYGYEKFSRSRVAIL